MGAGTSLYSATCYTEGKFGNGNPYTIDLSAVVGLSGWLPCSKFGFFSHCFLFFPNITYQDPFKLLTISFNVNLFSALLCQYRNLRKKVEGDEAGRRAASLPILLCHGRGI